MAKVDKKKRKLSEEIERLEEEMRLSLTKKTSDIKEISVPLQIEKINKLKRQLAAL